jgi:amino acid permease
MSIVYYPLWVFRYRYKNHIYQIVFDALTGAMLSGSAPGNNKLRILAHLGSTFFGMLFMTTAMKSGDSAIAFWGVIIAIALMYLGYKRFRYGKEVVYKLTKEGPVSNILQKIKQKLTVDNLIESTKKG